MISQSSALSEGTKKKRKAKSNLTKLKLFLVISCDCRKTMAETENRRLDRSNRVWRKYSKWFSNYSCLIARPSFWWLLHALRWSVTNSCQCDAFSSRWQCRCHGSTDHWESLDCHCRTLWSRMPLLTETADSGSFVHSWAYSLRFVEADRKPHSLHALRV